MAPITELIRCSVADCIPDSEVFAAAERAAERWAELLDRLAR